MSQRQLQFDKRHHFHVPIRFSDLTSSGSWPAGVKRRERELPFWKKQELISN